MLTNREKFSSSELLAYYKRFKGVNCTHNLSSQSLFVNKEKEQTVMLFNKQDQASYSLHV